MIQIPFLNHKYFSRRTLRSSTKSIGATYSTVYFRLKWKPQIKLQLLKQEKERRIWSNTAKIFLKIFYLNWIFCPVNCKFSKMASEICPLTMLVYSQNRYRTLSTTKQKKNWHNVTYLIRQNNRPLNNSRDLCLAIPNLSILK